MPAFVLTHFVNRDDVRMLKSCGCVCFYLKPLYILLAGQFGVPFRAGGKSMVKDAEGKEIVDDTGKTVAIQRRVTTARWTIIIGKDGRILYRETAASPVNDSQEVLKFLSKLAAK